MNDELFENVAPRLKQCEDVVRSGMATFVAVGQALAEIRDLRLYREMFATFEEYCRSRWKMAARTAYQTITSARAALSLGDGAKNLNEATARVLAKLPENERKAKYLQALAEMPSVTADGLEKWLRRKTHITQPLPKSTEEIVCPHCGHEFKRYNLAAASRGNRTPSRAPSWFKSFLGRNAQTGIDFGCGRLRNAHVIEAVCDSVVFVDLPHQVERIRVISGERELKATPCDHVAEVVFLLQVLHIQADMDAMKAVAGEVMRSASRWVVVETPAIQSYYSVAIRSGPFSILDGMLIVDLFSGWRCIASRWTTAHNRAYIFERGVTAERQGIYLAS